MDVQAMTMRMFLDVINIIKHKLFTFDYTITYSPSPGQVAPNLCLNQNIDMYRR